MAQYVGTELTTIAALAELPFHMDDTPFDATPKEDAQSNKPSFAITCKLASILTGKEEPAGKVLQFNVDH